MKTARQMLASFLVLALALTLADFSKIRLFANPTMAYDQSDFVIVGTKLYGFTEDGANKHENLGDDNRHLIIPASWGITEIADNAFLGRSANAIIEQYGGSTHADIIWRSLEFRGTNYIPSVFVGDMPTTALNAGYIQSTPFREISSPFDTIKIPSTVTRIGDFAFAYSGGTEGEENLNRTPRLIEISGTNLSIGNFAFVSHGRTTTVKFLTPNEVVGIGAFAFHNQYPLVEVSGDFSASTKLTLIGDNAFTSARLNGFKLPSSAITRIGKAAFGSVRKSHNTTELTLPSSLTYLGEAAFIGSTVKITGLDNLTNITTIPQNAFRGARVGDIHLMGNITTIGDHAFVQAHFTGLMFEEGLASIGTNAFYKALYVSSGRIPLTLPNSLTQLGSSAFEECVAFSDVNIGTGLNVIPARAFHASNASTDKTPVIHGNLTIGANVISIGTSAFYRNDITNSPFTNATKLASIGDSAFYQAITTPVLTIPKGIRRLDRKTFSDCTIGSVVFEGTNDNASSLATIEAGAFLNAIKNQTKLTLPPSLRTIANSSPIRTDGGGSCLWSIRKV